MKDANLRKKYKRYSQGDKGLALEMSSYSKKGMSK